MDELATILIAMHRMGRAAGLGGAGGGDPIYYGLQTFSSANYWAATNIIPKGSTGFTVAAVVRHDATISAIQGIFSDKSSNDTLGGWVLFIDASSKPNFRVISGTPAAVTITHATALSTLDRMHTIVGRCKDGYLDIWLDGTAHVTPVAITGMTPASSALSTAIGVYSVHGAIQAPCTKLTIFGAVSSASGLTDQQCVDFHAACKAAVGTNLVADLTSPQESWRANDLITAPSTWPGDVAATVLNKVGTGATLVSTATPTWAV